MRYAIFSDIHANRAAWRSVLEDMVALEAEVLVCLGDIVGYGPRPQEVLDEIRARTPYILTGNHDAAATGRIDPSNFSASARYSADWTRRTLTSEALEFLRALPVSLKAENLLFIHAEIERPGRFGYIWEAEQAALNFEVRDEFVTFIGHTHLPTVFDRDAAGRIHVHAEADRHLHENHRYIVNVGSVGEPRTSDDLRACYVIYDSETRHLHFRRLPFDFDEYRADLAETGLQLRPFFLAMHAGTDPDAADTFDLALEAPSAELAGIAATAEPIAVALPRPVSGAAHPRPVVHETPSVSSKGWLRSIWLLPCALLLVSLTWFTYQWAVGGWNFSEAVERVQSLGAPPETRTAGAAGKQRSRSGKGAPDADVPASPITVSNPSFEVPAIAPSASETVPDGWTALGTKNVSIAKSSIRAFKGMKADGNQVACLARGSMIAQKIADHVGSERSRIRVQFVQYQQTNIGNRGSGIQVELWAGHPSNNGIILGKRSFTATAAGKPEEQDIVLSTGELARPSEPLWIVFRSVDISATETENVTIDAVKVSRQ